MDTTAGALADLRVSLLTAAKSYWAFAESYDVSQSRELFADLAHERESDALNLDATARSLDLEQAEPTLSQDMAAELLGLGRRNASLSRSLALAAPLATVVNRVMRSEGTLSRLASQLATVTPYDLVRDTLMSVREHISYRQPMMRSLKTFIATHIEYHHAYGRADLGVESRAAYLKSTPAIEVPSGEELTIWFATDRVRSRRGRFTSDRGDRIHYGKCEVFLPANRTMGSLGSGFLGRLVQGDNRVKLRRIETSPADEFWLELASLGSSLDPAERDALVFLHGYCNSFEDTAKRTAQLKSDLGHNGPAAFFAWPSLGSKHGYSGDEAAIEGSEAAIRNFLVDFAHRSGAERVHIIAHSMGNRGLLRAMDHIAREAALSSRVKFGQIILAAPDVDSELFRNLASAYSTLAQRSTLYVAENDQAIGLSAAWHRFDRVGRAPPFVVVAGIDTVNVSKINLDLLGHTYAADIRPVLADIYQLFRYGAAPDHRHGIRRARAPGANHWEFQR